MNEYLVTTTITERRTYRVKAQSVDAVHELHNIGYGSFDDIEPIIDDEPVEEIVNVRKV